MKIKFNHRMLRMKISHIMRKYEVTNEQAKELRSGNDIETTTKAPAKAPVTKTTSNKESK